MHKENAGRKRRYSPAVVYAYPLAASIGRKSSMMILLRFAKLSLLSGKLQTALSPAPPIQRGRERGTGGWKVREVACPSRSLARSSAAERLRSVAAPPYGRR